MPDFSPARGRKKEVAKFSRTQGLWVLAVCLAVSALMLLLFVLGLLRLDID